MLRAAERANLTVAALVGAPDPAQPVRIRALMWLYKLGLVDLQP
jgi:hypothetical protein